MSSTRCFDRAERWNSVLPIATRPETELRFELLAWVQGLSCVWLNKIPANAASTCIKSLFASSNSEQLLFCTSNVICCSNWLKNLSYFLLPPTVGIVSTILQKLDKNSATEPVCLHAQCESSARRSWSSGTNLRTIAATHLSQVEGFTFNLSRVYHQIALVLVNKVVAKEIRFSFVKRHRSLQLISNCNTVQLCTAMYVKQEEHIFR